MEHPNDALKGSSVPFLDDLALDGAGSDFVAGVTAGRRHSVVLTRNGASFDQKLCFPEIAFIDRTDPEARISTSL